MINYDICGYSFIQFCGYLLQILPLMFLFYVPFRQEALRFPKRRILLLLTVFYILVSAGTAVFLGTQVWQNVDGAAKFFSILL